MKHLLLTSLTLCFISTSVIVNAQTPHQRFREKILANNASYQKQAHVLDSVVSKYIEKDEQEEENLHQQLNASKTENWDDIPADDIYNGAWGTTGVNANRWEIKDIPDSVVIDCKGYVSPIIGGKTSCFGPRHRRFHYGIDLRLNTGDPVGSAFDGKVRITKYDRGGYGYYVVVRHPNGLETVYGHLSEIKVFEGQSVVAGQCIGLGGSTGRSSGPHLHFETRYLGNPINPEKIIDFEENKVRANNYFLVKSVAFDYSNRRNNKSYSSARRARYHKVRSGETLSHIADRYGISIKQLCRMNRISRHTTIRPGQRLRCS